MRMTVGLDLVCDPGQQRRVPLAAWNPHFSRSGVGRDRLQAVPWCICLSKRCLCSSFQRWDFEEAAILLLRRYNNVCCLDVLKGWRWRVTSHGIGRAQTSGRDCPWGLEAEPCVPASPSFGVQLDSHQIQPSVLQCNL